MLAKKQYSTWTTMKAKCLFAFMLGSCLILGILVWSQGSITFFPPKEVICRPDAFEKIDFTRNVNSTAKHFISYVHYLDTNQMRTVENFRYFMHVAHEPCNPDVDFVLILNVDSKSSRTKSIFDLKVFTDAFSDEAHLNKFKYCQDERNPQRNTYIVLRQNKEGGDLCANVELVKSDFWLQNKAKYVYYFFINSSARGPFLPNYWTRKW